MVSVTYCAETKTHANKRVRQRQVDQSCTDKI